MIVLVHMEREDRKAPSGWWAEIPDHPEFSAAANDWPELVKLVNEAAAQEGWERPVFTRPDMPQCKARPSRPEKLSCFPVNHSTTVRDGWLVETWYCSCGKGFKETSHKLPTLQDLADLREALALLDELASRHGWARARMKAHPTLLAKLTPAERYRPTTEAG